MTTKEFSNQLELTNDGRLSFFFLGTGNAFQKSYYQSNLLVIKGESHVLIDCGTLCPYILEKEYNTKLAKIKNVLFTHPHADHIGGAEEIILTAFYISKHKLNIVIPKKFKKILWNHSLKGGIQLNENGKLSFNDYFDEFPVKKILSKPFEMYESNIGSINVKLFRTRHITTRPDSFRKSQLSYGIIFDDRILFTGDTQYNPGQINYLLEHFPKIEHIFHDCDITGFSVGVHASYEQLKQFPADVRAKMSLYHYSKKMEEVHPEEDGFAGFVKRGVYYNF